LTLERNADECRGMMLFLKWFAMLWTTCAVAIVIVSNLMIANRWPPVLGVLPFDVQNDLRVALLLAPGLAAVIINLALKKWNKRTMN
jgi:hypothetical protein